MESTRQKKFNKMIQKELAEIFLREGKSVIGSAFLTVTSVRISPDLGLAKVYLSILQKEGKEKLLDTIRLKKGELRGHLGKRIAKHVRTIPDLVFFLDDSAEYASRIDSILGDLDIPPEEEEKGEDDDENRF